MIRCMSGLLVFTDWATCFNRVVFPAFGGDTIRPLWPFPTGLIRSMMRMATEERDSSRPILSSGKIGVMSSKLYRFTAASGV